MKPSFRTLKKNHYSSDKYSNDYKDTTSLYSEMGLDIDKLLNQNAGYENTCATRMSLALLKSGVTFAGRLKILDGPYKGKMIEPGAKLLADQLMRPTAFGRPEILDPTDIPKKVGARKGVVFFWKISGYGGGHIDLIEMSNSVQVCHSACYFASQEAWFWPLM